MHAAADQRVSGPVRNSCFQEAYAKAGAADNFTSFVEPGVGHVLTPAMWEHVKHVFAKHLSAA